MNVHANFPTAETPPPKPKPNKKRTITLTNRAPIRIDEDEWPIVAQGDCGDDTPEAPWGWSIEIRLRRHVNIAKRYRFEATEIIHAKFRCWDESDERRSHNQIVRVGRTLTSDDSARDLWKHILEVADELRGRIGSDHLKKHVVYAVDELFAALPPHEA